MTDPTVRPDDGLDDAWKPAARGDLLLRSYGTETVAWSPAAPLPAHLDPVATVVLQVLDGSGSVADLVQDIHEVVGIPLPVARNRLRSILTDFASSALLQTGSSPAAVPHARLDFFPAPPSP